MPLEKVDNTQLKRKTKSKRKKSKPTEQVMSEDDEPLAQVLQQKQIQHQTLYQQSLLVLEGVPATSQANHGVSPVTSKQKSMDTFRDRKLIRRSTATSEGMRKSRQSQDAKSLSKSSSKATLVSHKSVDSRSRNSSSNEQQRKTLVRPENSSDEDEPLATKVQNMNTLTRMSISKKERASEELVTPLRPSKSFDQTHTLLNTTHMSKVAPIGLNRKNSIFRRILGVFKTKTSQEHKPIRFEDLKLPEFTSLDPKLHPNDNELQGEGGRSDYFGDLGFEEIICKYGTNFKEEDKPKNDPIRRKSLIKRAPTPDYDIDPQLAALYSSISFQ